MLSIYTIPSIPVCRQAGMLGLSNGVNATYQKRVSLSRNLAPVLGDISTLLTQGDIERLTFYVSTINLKVVLSLEEEGDEEVLL